MHTTKQARRKLPKPRNAGTAAGSYERVYNHPFEFDVFATCPPSPHENPMPYRGPESDLRIPKVMQTYRFACGSVGLATRTPAIRSDKPQGAFFFFSRNRRRVLIQGNGHFCGFGLFQLEHVAKGNFWKPGTFAKCNPQRW